MSVQVSVIIPVYNAESTLMSCVDSILHQTHTDIEVLLVDDGSTDRSLALCQALCQKDSRIQYLHQANAGQTKAREAGVNKAQGEWVTFVDDDDTLLPTAIEDLLARTDNSTDIILGNGQSLPHEHRAQIPLDEFRHLAVRGEGSIGLVWGSMYRRTAITPYNFDIPSDIRIGEDYIFWLRLVFHTQKPVNVLYKNIYKKGADHYSGSFVWTADYAQRIHELRKASIPSAVRPLYLKEMVTDRIDNLFEVTIHFPRSAWENSPFYQEIQADIKTVQMTLPLKHRLFLALPSRSLRKLYSHLSNLLFRTRKMLGLFRKNSNFSLRTDNAS